MTPKIILYLQAATNFILRRTRKDLNTLTNEIGRAR